MQLSGIWDKIPSGPGRSSTQVKVIILGFGQISSGANSEVRPVAIIQDLSDDNRLRYAELKYVRIQA